MHREPHRYGLDLPGFCTRRKRFTLVLLLGGCLAACQSAGPTSPYLEWQAPAGAQAQRCVAQCEADRWRCSVRQTNDQQYCQTQARLDLSSCKADQRARLSSCLSTLQTLHGDQWQTYAGQCSSFITDACRLAGCATTDSCQRPHEQCFLGCGGRIEPASKALQRL